ncbi:hypothetical protein VTN77DRAFT_142 [Rasamsonia byssochlamydoides]|uniref:uncharacterized protein n=1 Tax=Rasamsonia byssochlamydoides TaxID=89139 RepID=UPI0037449AC1
MPATLHRPTTAPSNSPARSVNTNASTSSSSLHDNKPSPPSSPATELPASISTSTSTSDLRSSHPETMAPSVNRKKQKRRQKQAARLAAEQKLPNGDVSTEPTDQDGNARRNSGEHADSDVEDGEHHDHANHEEQHGDEAHASGGAVNGKAPEEQESKTTKSSKKKKKKSKKDRSQTVGDESSTPLSTPSASTNRQPQNNTSRPSKKSSKDRIWNTSTQEERENIKKFWLELGEEERRALVKVEKDAVLKKMKEQQKHSCSCTVCGRKRTAIEEELEVLYDAYYEELEQYANNNQGAFENGAPIVPPPRLYQPRLHSLDRHTHLHGHHHPSQGRVHELPDDEEELEEDYDEDDEDDEPYSDDDLEDEASRNARADFFAFGNSLTVKDGILTVADDLLKNDGKHFIDMMEQLAERRMQREEDAQYGMAAAHQSLHAGHNHGPLDEDDYDDEEDDDYDSQDDEEYEEDEMDAMTEEQRMEEGRRMFQIFAARMFEQRVLTAYREKVAEQRQELLLQELLEEQNLNEQRSAKKAREAQKRKDKKRQQKQAREEERARREAEKAAEEAAARALEEKKQEEQRRKREEQRKKKEAEKKAQEEERLRKEAEKQRRLQEERERQAEQERKHREQKEREKKKREEARKKEREEREAKEREQREKKAKEERERKAREEEQAKREKEAAAKAEQEAKERAKSEAQAAPPSQPTAPGTKRPSQPGPGTIPVPPGLQHPQGTSAVHSPHFQVATPVVPKAPTPARPRQPSQQGSHTSSPHSQPATATEPLSSISPQTLPLSQSSGTPTSSSGKIGLPQQPVLHHPQPSAPLSPLGGAGRSHPLGFPTMNGLPTHPPPGISGIPPRPIGHENIPLYPPHSGPVGSQFRGFPTPNGIPMPPPGISPGRPVQPPGRGFPLDNLPFSGQPPVPGPISTAQPTGRSQGHSRQASGSFERSPLETQAQTLPISRPTPIKRPSSSGPQKEGEKSGQSDVDELSAQLGSSALLDDTDIPFTSNLSQSLPGPPPIPGPFGPSRASFGASPLFPDPLGAPKHPSFSGTGGTWSTQGPFGVPPFPGASTWGTGTGGGWPNHAFGIGGHHRAHTSRPVAIRLLVIQACKNLNAMSPSKGASGFHDVNKVLRQVEQLKPPNEPPISLNEMLDICDTEGNPQNGGGSFTVKEEGDAKFVKFEPDTNSALSSHRGSLVPGDIGSPVPSSSLPAFGGFGAASGSRQFTSPTSF